MLAARGAARIYAVDVGHDQLHDAVRALPVVVSMEGTNVRHLDRAAIPEPVDLAVCDISFVSVTKVLTAPLALCRPGRSAVILIKPQFEVGRAHVGKGGIVSDDSATERAIAAVLLFMSEQGFAHRLSVPSPFRVAMATRKSWRFSAGRASIGERRLMPP